MFAPPPSQQQPMFAPSPPQQLQYFGDTGIHCEDKVPHNSLRNNQHSFIMHFNERGDKIEGGDEIEQVDEIKQGDEIEQIDEIKQCDEIEQWEEIDEQKPQHEDETEHSIGSLLVDSGASAHIATDKSKFISFQDDFKPEQHSVEYADGHVERRSDRKEKNNSCTFQRQDGKNP